MGRARGQSAAVTVTAFDDVMGTRRGVGTVSIDGPDTPAARSAHFFLFEQARRGELEEPLRMLRKHRKDLSPPLLADLHETVAQALAQDTHRRWGSVATDFTNVTCDGVLASTIIEDGAGMLHLWAAGAGYAALPEPTEKALPAVCELAVSRESYERAPRGAWYRARHQGSGKTVCPECLQLEGGFPETADFGDSSTPFPPPHQRQFLDALEAECADRLTAHVTSPRGRTENTLRMRGRDSYRELVVTHAYQQLQAGGHKLAERVCAPRPIGSPDITAAQVKALTRERYAELVEPIERHTTGGKAHNSQARPITYIDSLEHLQERLRNRLASALAATGA